MIAVVLLHCGQNMHRHLCCKCGSSHFMVVYILLNLKWIFFWLLSPFRSASYRGCKMCSHFQCEQYLSICKSGCKCNAGESFEINLWLLVFCVWTQITRLPETLIFLHHLLSNSSPSNMSVSPLILLHHADFYDYGSHTGGCKFSFKLIKSIQLALHQSDFTAKSVWSIFSHSAWGLTFHWLCPCSLNTCKKDSSWKTVRRKYVFLFQLRRSLWGFFR